MQEIVQLWQVVALQSLQSLLGGGLELPVACLQLLQTLEVGRELVSGLHQGLDLRVGLGQQRGEGRLHLRREHGREPGCGVGFHGLVGGLDGVVGVLYRGRKVPGEDLRGVVVQRHGGHVTGVDGPAELVPADHRQGVGQDGHHVGVLLDVLRVGVAHEAPAADVAHPRDVGKKGMRHSKLP